MSVNWINKYSIRHAFWQYMRTTHGTKLRAHWHFNGLKRFGFSNNVGHCSDLVLLRMRFCIHLARIKITHCLYFSLWRLFGAKGFCTVCCKTIPAFEMVMRARENVYHLECFSCQRCHQRFCVGDKFYLINNRILCVDDYEEMMSYGKPDTKRFIV